MWVVSAALSCFSRPPPRISSLVALEFGDGVGVLPGSGEPSIWGDVLSERDRSFLIFMLGGSSQALLYSMQFVPRFLFPRGMRKD